MSGELPPREPRPVRLQRLGDMVEPRRAVVGWISVIFGAMAVFWFAPLFAPFGYLFALFALIRGQVLLALAGIGLSTFGLATSPLFLTLLAAIGIGWWLWPF